MQRHLERYGCMVPTENDQFLETQQWIKWDMRS